VTDPLRAAAIMLPILIVQDIVSLWAYRREWDRRVFLILFGGAVFGVMFGAAFATRVPTGLVLLMVGLIASGFVVIHWTKARRANGAEQPARPAAIGPGLFWGFWLGFTSFLVNAGAPPFHVYMLPQKLPPQRYAGIQTYVFAAVNLFKLAVFAAIGQLRVDNFAVSASLFPVAILATCAGIWLVRRVTGALFYKLVYGLTFVLGVKLIISGLGALV
jgi:hypothetical protein